MESTDQDFVDTSDVEEREILAPSEDRHWNKPASTRLKGILADTLVQQRCPDNLTLPILITSNERSSDSEVDNPSPRKRIKTVHDAGSVLYDPALTITTEASAPNSPREMSPSASTLKGSQERMLTGEGIEQPPVPHLFRDISPRSDWSSLFSPRSQLPAKQTPPGATGQGLPQGTEASSSPRRPPQSLSCLLSISTDRVALSTPPRHGFSNSSQIPIQHSRDPETRQSISESLASSPLTPLSSPALVRTPSASPDPLRLPSVHRRLAHHVPSLPDPPAPRVVYPPPTEIPEDPQPLNRYTLRRREARQLNPYAYDKLQYKQQLRELPDAIVKFRSPRHRSGSCHVDEDGTQGESVFPLDNPDDDGDYVDVEGERARRRAKSFNHNNEIIGDAQERIGTEPIDTGWLPEVLKELSSSDDDDTEIYKLAKKIRKEREKAEAISKAEARKIAAEARRVETEKRKTAKRRLKPFPVYKDGEQKSACPPPSVSFVERSPSLPLFSRALSESMIVSHPSTPVESRRPLVSPRALSVSQNSSPNFHPMPDFNVYLQQDDAHRFDDFDVHLPQNFSPDDESGVNPAASSPLTPPATSDVSALLSNTSETGTESGPDQPSVIDMSSRDKKRLRALKRMMPAAMIAKQLEGAKTARAPPRTRIVAESPGSEAEEDRSIPGLARVRRGKHRSVEVRGDPESSEIEGPTEAYDDGRMQDMDIGERNMLSDGLSAVEVKRTRHVSPRIKPEADVISLSDSSVPDSSSEESESDEEKVHRKLFDRPERGPVRERSLIDWMLSRTRNSSGHKFKSKQSTGGRKASRYGAPPLDIVTSGARRLGQHHQTLLPFTRVDSATSTTSSTKYDSEHRRQTVHLREEQADEDKRKKKRKRQSKLNQGQIYSVHHDATRISSKHRESKSSRGRTPLIIENDDKESRQALDPAWRAEVERWNRPISPAPRPAVKMATSAPTSARPRIHRRISPRPQNELPLPYYFQPQEEPFASVDRHIVIDMNITPLPSGVKFGVSTYIGRGLLHRLVSVTSGNSEAVSPMSCSVQGFEISSTTSAEVFSALLGPLCDRLASALRDSKVDNADTIKEWDLLTRVSSQLLSWLVVRADDQEFASLEVALRECLDGLMFVLESLDTTTFSLTAHWFVVELFSRLAAGIKYRRGTTEGGYFTQSVKRLMQRLLDIDLHLAFTTFHAAEGDVDVTLLSHRAVELWVCLIHLLPSFEISPGATPSHPLWRLLADLYPECSTGLEASEHVWHMIFSLCAISQFSVHGLSTSLSRLPAAWELVATALKKIVLTDNPDKDRQLPPRALKKRDDYVSCVVCRCFLLWSQWGWRLDDGIPMFKSLQEIFRSRNFANLLSERSVPMGFLENGDLELLSKQDPGDSVFEIFLKMVVQAVQLLNANAELEPKQRSAHIKKLLQLAVPVSPVPFSRSMPPSAHSLSMLVNRFNAMAVAVHLDPTLSNVKFRIVQARRCVNFKDADEHSRMACVYGMMNFAIIVSHHKIAGGLEEVLGWLGEMADVLMDEYKEGDAGVVGKSAATLIQLLIGSVRRVIQTPSLDKGQSRVEYPDPALLDGPWVTRVFNPRVDLVTIQQTGVEIRMLVQSFLEARLKALPAAQPPPPPVAHSVESQESQDEYDKLFLDLNDEELLAALGEEAEVATVANLKSKEDALCKVLDKFITPAVYRLVCKHLGESECGNHTASMRVADEWIDCWVGCANVLVQNNYKEWGLYMKLGQQSWEKIIDRSWRRRVGLRFNLRLLILDPGAYHKMKEDFISVLLVATLSRKPTIEHEYIGLVLSLDGLQHPLLHGALVDPIPGTRKYEVSMTDYDGVRGRLIETAFANAARCHRAKIDAESQGYVGMVVMMLSTMQDIYEVSEEKEEYGQFCRRVYEVLLGCAELASHDRMADGLAWGRRVIGVE